MTSESSVNQTAMLRIHVNVTGQDWHQDQPVTHSTLRLQPSGTNVPRTDQLLPFSRATEHLLVLHAVRIGRNGVLSQKGLRKRGWMSGCPGCISSRDLCLVRNSLTGSGTRAARTEKGESRVATVGVGMGQVRNCRR